MLGSFDSWRSVIERSKWSKNRPARVDLRRPAVVVDSQGDEHVVTILDISSGGFRLQLFEGARIGEFVTVRAEHGASFTGQIRWALGDEAGGVFLTGVDERNLP